MCNRVALQLSDSAAELRRCKGGGRNNSDTSGVRGDGVMVRMLCVPLPPPPPARNRKRETTGPEEEEERQEEREEGEEAAQQEEPRAHHPPPTPQPSTDPRRPSPTIGAKHQLGVAKLQEAAALLPEQRRAPPILTPTLRLGADGAQHAEESHCFLSRPATILKGEGYQTRTRSGIAAALASRSISRGPAAVPRPRPKPGRVIRMRTGNNRVHEDGRTSARIMGHHVEYGFLNSPRGSTDLVPLWDVLLRASGHAEARHTSRSAPVPDGIVPSIESTPDATLAGVMPPRV